MYKKLFFFHIYADNIAQNLQGHAAAQSDQHHSTNQEEVITLD